MADHGGKIATITALMGSRSALVGVVKNYDGKLSGLEPGPIYTMGASIGTDWLKVALWDRAVQFLNLTSTVATGTAPYACTSETLNTHLNADLLDGNHASAFLTAEADTLATVMARGATTGVQLTSTLAIGTSPFAVTSTTVNANLNADLWDGYQFSDYLDQAVKTTSSPTFVSPTITAASANSYKFTTGTALSTSQLAFESQLAGGVFNLRFFTKSGNGEKNVFNNWTGVGTVDSLTNSEYLNVGYIGNATPASRYCEISSLSTGTGTARPIKIYVGTNTAQLVLNPDGTITTSHRLRSDVGFNYNGHDGRTQTINIIDGGGVITHHLVFYGGILIGYITT